MTSEELIDDLVRLWRVFHQVTSPRQQGDITPQQFWLLRELARRGPLRIGTLATVLGISQSAATVAVQRLERAGLVRRIRDQDDERAVMADLTPEGARHVEHWREQRRAAFVELLAPLQPAEQAELHRLLGRMLSRVDGAST